MGKQWELTDFILEGSKITADGKCSHEITRCLFFGRKAMTNLDSTLKSRDIILSTKVCLVKAMVFPVVLYGCENWTIKKAEHRRCENWTIKKAEHRRIDKLSIEELMLLTYSVGEDS